MTQKQDQKISKKTFVEKKVEQKRLKYYSVDEKDHILNNQVFYEEIDIDVLNKLLRSTLLRKTLQSPFADYYYDNERDQLNAYAKLIKRGKAEVQYHMKEGITAGRVIPNRGLGLFNIRRELRQTLCKHKYIDIDVENCHPVILLQICQKNKIETHYLDEYVTNRKEILKEHMEIYETNRDATKRLFIRLMYFGGFKNWAKELRIKNAVETDFIKNFTTEIKQIGMKIFECNKELYEQIKKSKEEKKTLEFNEIGSVCSYFLQEWEHRILEEIYVYCVDNGIINNNDCVLCADGLMIKKEKYEPKLLKTFEKLIKKNLDLDVVFTQKEMKEDYLNILDSTLMNDKDFEMSLLNNYDTTIDQSTIGEDFHIQTLINYFNEDIQEMEVSKYKEFFKYTKSFKYFNHYHFCHYQSGKLYKIYENKLQSYDSIGGLMFLKVKEGKQQTPFIELYDDCIDKNKYSSFDFNPNRKKISDKYNLFRGFKYDDPEIKFDITKIQHYLDHIKYICDGDEKASEYFINWLSHTIQKPECKTDVAIVIFSLVEGVGKNIIFDIHSKILSGYSAKFRDTNALTDKFNMDMMGKIFVVGDEINGRAQEIANELKDIITRKEENIEPKGKDKFMMTDYKNYGFTTNNENVFKVTKSDRRYFMLEAPTEKKSPDYYDKLVDLLEDDEALTHLHHYLKHRDIKYFSTRNIVVTDYKKRLMIEHIPAYLKFMNDKQYTTNHVYDIKNLYMEIIQYAKLNKLQSTFTETLFSRQFKEVFQDYNKLDIKTRRSIYVFPANCHEDIETKINNFIFNK